MWVVLTYSPHSVVYIRWRWAVGGRERGRAGAAVAAAYTIGRLLRECHARVERGGRERRAGEP